MSAPKTRAHDLAESARKLPTCVDGAIPTSHQPLDSESLEGFSDWLSAELISLETRFAAFTTRSSVKVSLQR